MQSKYDSPELSPRWPDDALKHEAQSRARVFVVDDHPLFRKAVMSLLKQDDGIEVVGDNSSARGALAALRQKPADLAVVDISLEGPDGLELIKHLRSEHPAMRFLVLSAHDENEYALRALRVGANGYVMKSTRGETILAAVRAVLAGEIYVSPDFQKKLVHSAVRGETPDLLSSLSNREMEVLRLVGAGKSTREIAQLLNVTVKTVETHRLNLRQKLQLKNSAELVRFAIERQFRQGEEAAPSAAETVGLGDDECAA